MTNLLQAMPQGAIPQHAANMIQKMIMEGKFKPGEMLPSQRELAAQLMISRTSLREALSVLTTLGLIYVQPGKGVFVRSTTPNNKVEANTEHLARLKATASQSYQLRYVLEPFALGLAAPQISDEVLSTLKGNVNATRQALTDGNLVDAAYLDFEFHRILIEESGNTAFIDVVLHCREGLMKSQQLPFSRHSKWMETADEHDAIIDQIERGLIIQAAEKMREHIKNSAMRAGIALELPADGQ